MSFERRHSDALLNVPWLTTRTEQGRWLFKYASHPDREGYVFVATNLDVVFYETLTAAAIPSRLVTLRGGGLAEMDVFEEAEGVLKQLARVTRERWDKVTVQVNEHGFFDKVVHLREGTFTWDFQMAEMRVPLPFIAKHLLGPMADLASTQEVDGNAVDKVGMLLEDPFVKERWKRITQGVEGEKGDEGAGEAAQGTEGTDNKEEPYSSPVPTPSPPPPPSPPHRPTPSQTSQRTKREREREEEEEVERRREEMRRRMGAGKGGRLGQRRR